MKVVFHVGPHKTGTTAIQSALGSNRQALASLGVHLPYSSLRMGGFHDLPWAIRGWNPRLLDENARIHSARDLLRRELHVAMNRQSQTLLISAEDLSLLTVEQWKWLINCTGELIGARNEPPEVWVTFTERPVSELLPGAYYTLVRLGCSLSFELVAPSLERHFTSTFQRLRELHETIPQLHIQQVAYQRDDFLAAWFRQVVPEIEESCLDLEKLIYNESPPRSALERLRQENESNNLVFDLDAVFDWPPLHTLESLERQRLLFIKTVPVAYHQ